MATKYSGVVLAAGLVAAVAAACGDPSSSQFGGGDDAGADGSGNGEGGGGQGPLGGGDGGAQNNLAITISPATASLTIVSRSAALTQKFVAKSAGGPVTAGWVLDNYGSGSIDSGGSFTTSGIVGGKTKITASFKSHTATADLNVLIKLSEDLPTPPSAANKGALDSPMPDPGGANATQIVYPLNGTVMPSGLTAPVLQFTPGSIPPQDAKVTLSCSTFSWSGYGQVAAPGTPQLAIPQDVWDAFTQSCAGEVATISVVKASGGMAYGPATTTLKVAKANLKGAVFYQTYDGAAGGPTFGLWSTRPGVQAPAIHLSSECVVCHSVSANGATLATGADSASSAPLSGAYKTNLNGTIQQVSASPAGLGGDTRGLSFAFLTPDGKYALRSTNDFWGGLNTRAFKVDLGGTPASALAEASVVGLASVSAYVPIFSPDGKHIAFINGDGAAMGTARKSVSIMDADVNPAVGANGTLTFTNQKVLLDNGAGGGSSLITKYPAFLPDSDQIVLQEGTNGENGYGGMLAYYGVNTGKIFLLRKGEHIELKNINTSAVVGEEDRNYMPTSLPVQAGGYFWVVFTSRRSYGNTYTGANVRKQLYVAAIDPTSAAGVDPSHPAFHLPNQTDTANDRGFWALEPCVANGTTCETSDQCCGGRCSPPDPSKPTVKTCGDPPVGQCRDTDEKCDTGNVCCSGLTCLAGTCAPPTVK